MINIPTWMFISSFEKLRKKLLKETFFASLLHLGRGVFGSDFGTVTFVINNTVVDKMEGVYRRLFTKAGSVDSLFKKESWFLDKSFGYFNANQHNFEKIPRSPIAYWVNDFIYQIFNSCENLGDFGDTREGLTTGDNELFLRYWHETNVRSIGLNIENRKSAISTKLKWFPYNKGGDYAKWYANIEYIVNWENDGLILQTRKHPSGRVWAHNFNLDYIFKPSISWTAISNRGLGFRFFPKGFLFDANGLSFFPNNKHQILRYLGVLNSKVAPFMMRIINSSVKFNAGDISLFPVKLINEDSTDTLIEQCIDISKEEWDSRETSWDFTCNELLKHKRDSKIETAFKAYCDYWREKFNTLHVNEEELNRLFIDIYELQDELTPDVDLEDITILKKEKTIIEGELVFNADEIMKQFISYGVGVMFGRYSLDSEGLLVANMGQEVPTDTSFEIDDDNIIPVLEDDYFKDDIASRFVQFVKTAFGEEHLHANIQFIEEALGTTIRKYFVKGFYEDHMKRYKKRPIYWMVSSPKKSFNALFYMHRYQEDIFARIQNSYLREYITKLEAAQLDAERIANDESNSASERKKATKLIDTINKKSDEIIKYDRDALSHFAQSKEPLDLDDGVKVNYCKFKVILHPISGLCK